MIFNLSVTDISQRTSFMIHVQKLLLNLNPQTQNDCNGHRNVVLGSFSNGTFIYQKLPLTKCIYLISNK